MRIMLLPERTYEKFGYYPDQIGATSKKELVFQCDYCGEESIKAKSQILNQREFITKDACPKCRQTKKDELMILKYGVKNVFQKPEVKEKINSTNLEKYGTTSPINFNSDIVAKKKQTNIQKYGIANPGGTPESQEKRKKVMLEKYGVDHPSKSPELSEKRKRTFIEKYGVEFPGQSQKLQDKVKATHLERRGVENPFSDPEIQKQARASMLEKYGVEHCMQSPEFIEQAKQTCIEKYGGPNPTFSEKVREKQKATNLEKYGVEYASQNPKVMKKVLKTRLKRYGTLTPVNMGQEQTEIQNWLNSLGFNFKSNLDILDGKEIDMYDDSIKLGIEYCGLHWHHEQSPHPRLRGDHIYKYKECSRQQIRLITIFSDEWLNRQNQIKGFLLSVLNQNKTVGARKCELVDVDPKVAVEFCNNNHIQQSKQHPSVAFGLKYGDELVAVITLGKHHRQKHQDCVLRRLCFSPNYSIAGGASRLFEKCKEWAKQEKFDKIISWSDNRWSIGNVYSKLGFTMEKEYGADYAYIPIKTPTCRIAKQNMQKKFIECPPDVKEHVHALSLGFARIWDCGKKRWVYTL